MEIFAVLLVLGLVLAAVAASYFVSRYFRGVALFGLWAVLGTTALYMASMAAMPSFEAITYMVLLYFGCVPVAVGFAIGSLIGLILRKRTAEA